MCLPSYLDMLSCIQMSPICSSPFSLVPDGVFQNATLLCMFMLCVQSVWLYFSIEPCMLIIAGQNILDSGGTLHRDSYFASLTC